MYRVGNFCSDSVYGALRTLQLRDEIGASPVDIARAYMGSRTSEVGSILKSSLPEDPKALLHGDGYLHKTFSPSPLPKSSVCWPGSVVQDRYLTPQTQRGSHGTPTFHRTPYSRPVHSMSKSKVCETCSVNLQF